MRISEILELDETLNKAFPDEHNFSSVACDKLRKIVELMPEIEEYVNLAYSRSGNAGIQNGILALRNKLKKWMEE